MSLLHKIQFFLYSSVIRLIPVFVFLGSFVTPTLKVFRKTRKNWKPIAPQSKTNRRVLVHAASLGEYEIAIDLITKLEHCGFEVFVSFFSHSGFLNAPCKNKLFLPYDTPTNVHAFLDTYKPDHVVFVAYEYWFNMMRLLHKRRIPYSYFAMRNDHIPWFYKMKLGAFIHLFEIADQVAHVGKLPFQVQNHNRKTSFYPIQDPRINRSLANRAQNINIDYMDGELQTFIYGSVYVKDLPLIKSLVTKYGMTKHVVVPHEVNESNILRFKDQLGSAFKILSNYEPIEVKHHNIIVDSIGQLKYLYKYASLIYVGGGLNKGVHNVYEPLVYKKPILISGNIGPYQKLVNEYPHIFHVDPPKSITDISTQALAIEKIDLNIANAEKDIGIFVNKIISSLV